MGTQIKPYISRLYLLKIIFLSFLKEFKNTFSAFKYSFAMRKIKNVSNIPQKKYSNLLQ